MQTVGHSATLGLGPMGLGYHDPVYSDDPTNPQGVATVLPDESSPLLLVALVLLVLFLET